MNPLTEDGHDDLKQAGEIHCLLVISIAEECTTQKYIVILSGLNSYICLMA